MPETPNTNIPQGGMPAQGIPLGQTPPPTPNQGMPLSQTPPPAPNQGMPLSQTPPPAPSQGMPLGQTPPPTPNQGMPLGQAPTPPSPMQTPNTPPKPPVNMATNGPVSAMAMTPELQKAINQPDKSKKVKPPKTKKSGSGFIPGFIGGLMACILIAGVGFFNRDVVNDLLSTIDPTYTTTNSANSGATSDVIGDIEVDAIKDNVQLLQSNIEELKSKVETLEESSVNSVSNSSSLPLLNISSSSSKSSVKSSSSSISSVKTSSSSISSTEKSSTSSEITSSDSEISSENTVSSEMSSETDEN